MIVTTYLIKVIKSDQRAKNLIKSDDNKKITKVIIKSEIS